MNVYPAQAKLLRMQIIHSSHTHTFMENFPPTGFFQFQFDERRRLRFLAPCVLSYYIYNSFSYLVLVFSSLFPSSLLPPRETCWLPRKLGAGSKDEKFARSVDR